MDNVNFSIIMPSYNRAFCIKNAIDAVLSQSYQNFELIISDDGSTDDTENLIKNNYSDKLNSGKIVYIKSQKNSGASKARNKAINIAKNEWITYVDTDNIPAQFFLETFLQNINENDLFYYAKTECINSKNIIGHKFVKDLLAIGNFIDMGVLCHHKILYEKFGGFDERFNMLEDWDLVLRYTNKTNPVFIDKIILQYNDSEDINRISNSKNFKKGYAYISIKHNLYLKRFFNPYSNEYYRRFKNFLKNKLNIKF